MSFPTSMISLMVTFRTFCFLDFLRSQKCRTTAFPKYLSRQKSALTYIILIWPCCNRT
jgi:hypothetical protein